MIMLRNFDTPLDTAKSTTVPARAAEPHVAVTSSVTVTQQAPTATAFLSKEYANWQWSDLRDYVVDQITSRFGVFPRDERKEASVFKSFLSRYPDTGPQIARFAFDVHDGYWMGAPISVNRFCKASDQYFAEQIVPRLVTEEVKGW